MQDLTFEECSAILLTGCIDYAMAAKRTPEIFGTFILWFAATNAKDSGTFFSQEARKLFPGLSEMSRSEQIIAARRFVLKPSRGDVLNDYRNELTDNWRWTELRTLAQGLRTE
ncbi:hypothetical protein WGT02_28455 (plasmid) [Rhizobium sp. T1470]|uniref:hypothetical protein n=1 Tax=unclassified Rhizobium TaxID=2613769 RepID=UPI001AAE1DE0|nr:hypothetical protein [Rhizobium sp. T1473]MCA0805152.1 hypothetical protein [Rhizobium sp. T1473]